MVIGSFKAHANGRNIVGQQDATLLGPNMLRPFALNYNNVGTCWHLLALVSTCWHLLALVAYSLKPVKFLGPRKWPGGGYSLFSDDWDDRRIF